MISLSAAEALLQSLGVETPDDIDLQAIAYHLGVIDITTRRLDGCEARIVGMGSHAIISVNAASIPQRRRFSVCHELGHWQIHRGQTLYCKAADIADRDVSQVKEREANRFAADLLLPPYLLRPMMDDRHILSLRKVDEIRGVFKASRSASAIQMIRLHAIPALLAFTSTTGRCWSIGGPRVPRGLKTRPDIGSESYAFEILHNSAPDQPNPRQIRADVWFDRRGSDRFRVMEQSFAVSDNTVATLISFTDPQMLEIYKDGW